MYSMTDRREKMGKTGMGGMEWGKQDDEIGMGSEKQQRYICVCGGMKSQVVMGRNV